MRCWLLSRMPCGFSSIVCCRALGSHETLVVLTPFSLGMLVVAPHHWFCLSLGYHTFGHLHLMRLFFFPWQTVTTTNPGRPQHLLPVLSLLLLGGHEGSKSSGRFILFMKQNSRQMENKSEEVLTVCSQARGFTAAEGLLIELWL